MPSGVSPCRTRTLGVAPAALIALALLSGVVAPRAVAADGSSGLTPLGLRCDWMVDPLGVDSSPPRLSWQLEGDGRRGLRQKAWQVLVASSPERLTAERGDVWDSGRVESADQLHVPYGGRPLRSAEQVFWKVKVWDGEDEASAWSAPATWTMGVIEPADWHGRWITDPALRRWARPRLGYRSADADTADAVKWVQVDLGAAYPVDKLVFRAVRHTVPERFGFPRRFRVEAATRADFGDAVVVRDQTAEDHNPWLNSIEVEGKGIRARYVRLTATRLRLLEGTACLALSQIEVLSSGRNVAVGAPVTAGDSLEQAPWSAAAATDGLGVPGANPRANDTLLLRREFPVRAGLRRAIVNVSGLGHYEMTVNGRRVGESLLTPGWTDYDRVALYDTHDLTSRLRPGRNAIGLLLGGGLYNVQGGRYHKFVSAFRPLAAIAQVRLEYEDGTVDTVGTDGEWRVAPGPIVFSNVYGGEDEDARLTPRGWDEPGFDQGAWSAAAVTDTPPRVLRGASQASPPFRTFEALAPVAVRELRPGVAVYDFGQNTSMMPRLRVRGPRGASVTMIPAELLKTDGSVDRGSAGGGEAWWRYTLAGRPEGEAFFPRFFYHGSRYLQVERATPAGAALPEVESLESVVVHSDSPPAGEFACSSELFNRIRTLVRWAQRSNLAHVISDCPHRERLGWLEQYHLNGPSLRYETDLTRLYVKGFADMADAQQPNGLVPDIAPEYVVFDGGFRDSPEWGSAFILAAWQHYVWTGDDRPLVRNYEGMKRYVAYLASRSSDGIVGHGLGDWYDIGPKPPGYAQLTPIALTATAIYYEDLETLARIAARLGRPDDAKRHAEDAARVKSAFNRKFFDPAASVYAAASQTAQAMPLVLGLVPEGYGARVLEALVRDVRAHGNGTTAGDVGYRYVLRALADGGRSDVIYDMNHQSDKPGYGYQLARGATSLTEAWDANPRSSQNHFMLGQIMEWFYGDLVGLAPDPDSPGFERVRIRPQPVSGITWARAAYASPRGRVSVAWRKEGGTFFLDIELPPNTQAEVWMPSADEGSLREGGVVLAAAPGVRLLRQEGGRAVLAIEAGHYAFSSSLSGTAR
jgi:alpha-L-rhamnosidase